ncbi:carboxypeptidase-like regulatory domain-containing protein [Aquimarina celericrescens]|uniref:Carboxypeptidase-like regulatory domain-containing protein n=1 Tax=Aquimarina celericrescens TaxID=1964542 RepID=A0ABW5B0L1_9FLAO|nr:carboxypeptidase-like regulatory domain-containing protein [Aquimarina celericrescens]
MKNNSFFLLVQVTTILFSISLFSQEGTLTGVLNDNSGLPLPGVNIIIKGTVKGTQTDFDGKYSINCNVGDVLVFSYVGFDSKEILVTPEMFDNNDIITFKKKEPVLHIVSDAYANAIEPKKITRFTVPTLDGSKYKYNKKATYFQYHRIKAIDIQKEKNKVQLTYFAPDIFYEFGATSKTGIRFIKQQNLPQLQNLYSQGQPLNGQNTFLGPETGTIFSYGPRLSSLEFDESQYPYDQNGRLVPIGNGSSKNAIAYDNNVFETAVKTANSIFFNITTDEDFLGLQYNDNRIQDIFDRESSRFHEVELRYNNPSNADKVVKWDTFIKYSNNVDNQPNLNGFLNTILFTNWATPNSFENNQGALLESGIQRSFALGNFNNPLWLLEFNRNQATNDIFVASIQNISKISREFTLLTKFNHTYHQNKQQFGLLPGTTGFTNGFSSDKKLRNNTSNAVATLTVNKKRDRSDIQFTSSINYINRSLKYSLSEKAGFDSFSFTNPSVTNTIDQTINRHTFLLINRFKYEVPDWETTLSIGNTSYSSSIQNDKWFLPNLQLDIDLQNLLDTYWLSVFKVSASASLDVKEAPLYYANQSHNSLDITPEQIQGFVSNDDLFVNNELQLEEKTNYSLSTELGFHVFGGHVTLGLTYYHNTNDKSVFPVVNQGSFQLQNSAKIHTYGFEGSLDVSIYRHNNFSYIPGIVFTRYRNHVKRIYTNQQRIPIAGFSTISKNLIPGQPAGVLVGSAYERDDQNNIIIDGQGFPLVAANPKIIGNPIPDFSIGFSNSFYWKKLQFSFLVDYQRGGDVWNGTQNVLNYLGTSQQSANERLITGFLFDGVNQQGQPNTIPVDFANPANPISENRFVRYGFAGVAEDAIVDGSYINLKSINLSYSIKKNENRHFIRTIDVGIYGNNLFTYTKYKGASPYSSLFDQASSQGLQFFNTPITSEIGMNIKIKL